MSTHKVEIVPVVLENHPNADKLAIVKVFGYTVCVQKEMWKDKTMGAYIPPDSIVDTTKPDFSFLGEHKRIKVKKLRGIISQGLLVPAPEGSKIGDDVMEKLGITHYDPPEPMSTGGDNVVAPEGYRPNYDVESFHRYGHLFEKNEKVWVTEKIHGANARYCVTDDGKLFCGSRTSWKADSEANIWWKVTRKYPAIERFLSKYPMLTLYGEVYGAVQSLKYGHSNGHVSFAGFDILHNNQWMNAEEAFELACDNQIPWVPVLSQNAIFAEEGLKGWAEGASLVGGADHIREGIVIKPLMERTHPEIGRVQLKIVSNGYLERE